MSKPDEFEEYLAEALDVVDSRLAAADVPLWERPLMAAQDFVKFFMIEVDHKGVCETPPDDFLGLIHKEWFKIIFARVTAFYRQRYGSALDSHSTNLIEGCLPVYGTPFAFMVPHFTKEPGVLGETIWLRYHDCVEDEEDWGAWILEGPELHALSRTEYFRVRRYALEVGANLRVIKTGLMSLEATDTRVGALRGPILGHLEKASRQLVSANQDSLKHAHWDLQMACELGLKLLSQQRAGKFTETHDLYCLYDRLPQISKIFPRALLSAIPPWEKMAEWRYGGGEYISNKAALSRYRTTLKIVRNVAECALRKYQMWRAGFEIKKAPFLHDDPSMYLPGKNAT